MARASLPTPRRLVRRKGKGKASREGRVCARGGPAASSAGRMGRHPTGPSEFLEPTGWFRDALGLSDGDGSPRVAAPGRRQRKSGMPPSQQVEITIGPYEIVGRPSVGDALTYIARKPSAQGRGKLYLLHVVQLGENLERDLEHEVQLSAGIMHPAKPHVVDFFQWESSYVLAFEHVDGVRLSRLKSLLERGGERLHDEAVWYLGLQVMGALARAHVATDAFGTPAPVVHARLGPQRILVSWEGRVMLVGLGLPTILEIEARADVADEETPAYLAPEQREGRRATPGADVYAAAVILWSLLAGRKPPLDVERLPSLRKLRPDVPEAISNALDLALEPSVGARKIRCVDIERELRKVANVPSGKAELRDRLEMLRALLGLWSLAPPQQGTADPTSLPPPAVLRGAGGKPIWREAAVRWDEASEQEDAGLPEELGQAVYRPKPAPKQQPAATGQQAASTGQQAPSNAARAAPSSDGELLAGAPPLDDGTPAALVAAPGASPGRPSPADAELLGRPAEATTSYRPSAPRPSASKVPVDARPAARRTPSAPGAVGGLRAEAAKPRLDSRATPEASNVEPTLEPKPLEAGGAAKGTAAAAPGKPAPAPAPTAPAPAAALVELPEIGSLDEFMAVDEDDGARPLRPAPPRPDALASALVATPAPVPAAAAEPRPTAAARPLSSGLRATAWLAVLAVVGVGGWLGMRALLADDDGASASAAASAAPPVSSSSARAPVSAGASGSASAGSGTPAAPSTSASSTEPADAGAPAATDAGQPDAAVPDAGSSAPSGAIPPPPSDGSDLLSYEGYLLVRSSATAQVFVQGKDLGPTNVWLRSRCTQRFIRIAAMPGLKWMSSGLGVRIACRGLTDVTIEPEPGLAP
jgi:hypothetical protein